MDVRASASVTLCTVRDVQAVNRYYKLQASTAAVPSPPTSIGTLPPFGWSATEPTYTSGSTNSLYTVDLTIFTDNTFNYSEVSLSSTYEAAKAAYNKAVAAANAASGAQTTADGKNTVFRQTSAPTTTGRVTGDVWFDTDDGNRIYTWNGSAWASTQMGSSAIADLSIVDAKIANGTISNGKIANLDAGKITTGTLSADRIAANTITGNKIAGTTITASNLAAGAVTTDKLDANAVTAAKIAAGTITASQIAGSTITGSKIAAGTISATNLATDSVTSDKIVAGNITTEKLAAKSVTANNMAANSITASNAALADASIVNAKIVDIDAGKIKTGYISADRIEGGSIVIGKLNSGLQTTINTTSSTATTANYKADEAKSGLDSLSKNVSENYTNTSTMNATFDDIRQDLSAASIANWCWQNNLTYIDGGKIYTGTVTASQIAARSITADRIVSGAITANEIASNAITTVKLAADAVTADKINVTALSAITANLGTVTAGILNSVTINSAVINSGTLNIKNNAGAVNFINSDNAQFGQIVATSERNAMIEGHPYDADHIVFKIGDKSLIDLEKFSPKNVSGKPVVYEATFGGGLDDLVVNSNLQVRAGKSFLCAGEANFPGAFSAPRGRVGGCRFKAGTMIANAADSAVWMFANSDINRFFGVSNANNYNTVVFVSNGDANAVSAHVDGATYLNASWRATFNSVVRGPIRLNYLIVYFG